MAFIVLEGGDGSGKTTQAALLKERLPKAFPNREFVITKDPGGTPYAEKIRALILSDEARGVNPKTMLDLFMAARFENVERLIAPALREGRVVVCERFVAATYAYQIAAENRPELLPLFEVHLELLKPCLPDLLLVLEVDPAMGLARVAERKGQLPDHYEKRAISFHEQLRAGYHEYAEHFALDKTVFIDASRGVEEVYQDILKTITPLISA